MFQPISAWSFSAAFCRFLLGFKLGFLFILWYHFGSLVSIRNFKVIDLLCNYRLGTRAINNWKRFQDVFLNTLTCPTLHVNFLRLQISRFFGSKIEHVPKKSPIYVEVFIRYIHPPEKQNMILQLPPASSQLNAVADQTIETRAIA